MDGAREENKGGTDGMLDGGRGGHTSAQRDCCCWPHYIYLTTIKNIAVKGSSEEGKVGGERGKEGEGEGRELLIQNGELVE